MKLSPAAAPSPKKNAPLAAKPRKAHAKDLDKRLKRPAPAELARMRCIHDLLERRRKKGAQFGKDHAFSYTLERLLEIVNSQLREEFGECSGKTLRRTLKAMQEVHGLPVAYDEQDASWCYTAKAGFPWEELDLPVFTGEAESLAVLVAQRALPQFEGTPFHEGLKRILLGLESRIKDGERNYLNEITRHIRFTGAATDGREAIPRAVWDALHLAFDERRTVEVAYTTGRSGATRWRKVDPYALFILGNKWNLLAFDHDSKEIRTFLTTRIGEIRETDETFTEQPGFHLDDYLADTVFGYPCTGRKERVVVRFDKANATSGKDTLWHRKQVQAPKADGSLTVSFETSALHMVQREVLAWGGGIEVLEPAKLRESVREAAKKVAQANT